MRNNNDLNALVGKGFVLDDVVLDYGEILERVGLDSYRTRIFYSKPAPRTETLREISYEYLDACYIYDFLSEARIAVEEEEIRRRKQHDSERIK